MDNVTHQLVDVAPDVAAELAQARADLAELRARHIVTCSVLEEDIGKLARDLSNMTAAARRSAAAVLECCRALAALVQVVNLIGEEHTPDRFQYARRRALAEAVEVLKLNGIPF